MIRRSERQRGGLTVEEPLYVYDSICIALDLFIVYVSVLIEAAHPDRVPAANCSASPTTHLNAENVHVYCI